MVRPVDGGAGFGGGFGGVGAGVGWHPKTNVTENNKTKLESNGKAILKYQILTATNV